MAAYRQYRAVSRAIDATLEAVTGDRCVGVVWHTQGSGQSLSMAFYAGKLARCSVMENPKLVVLTDRNDLDGQLFGNFAAWQGVLHQTPRRPRVARTCVAS